MHDDVHGGYFRALELLGLDAGDIQFLPGLRVICFLCSIDRLSVLSKLDMARSKPKLFEIDRYRILAALKFRSS
jgi:hypothetical protein